MPNHAHFIHGRFWPYSRPDWPSFWCAIRVYLYR